MFGPRGNPQARNLFGVLGYRQKQAGVALHVTPEPQAVATLKLGVASYDDFRAQLSEIRPSSLIRR